MERWRHQTENGSPDDFPQSVLPLAHRANRGLSFVHLFTNKQTEVTHLQTDSTDLPICKTVRRCNKWATYVCVNGDRGMENGRRGQGSTAEPDQTLQIQQFQNYIHPPPPHTQTIYIFSLITLFAITSSFLLLFYLLLLISPLISLIFCFCCTSPFYLPFSIF